MAIGMERLLLDMEITVFEYLPTGRRIRTDLWDVLAKI